MKKAFLSFLFLTVITTTFAQSTDKKADIKTLLEITGSGKIGKQVIKQMIAGFQQNYSSIEKKFFEDFEKEINEDELVNLVIPVYDKYYTHDDIKQLIAFYHSPLGKKQISIMPSITSDSYAAGQQWGRSIAEKILTRMKEQGYLDDGK